MSKQVADRESSSRAVIDVITEHETAIAAKHAELLGAGARRETCAFRRTNGPFGLPREPQRAGKPPLHRCEGFRDHGLPCTEQEQRFVAEPEGPFMRTTRRQRRQKA